MEYLKNFKKRIKGYDQQGLLKLWEEYCYSDKPDADELIQILFNIKNSEYASFMGNYVERALSLCSLIDDIEKKEKILQLILDIQTTNSEKLAELTYQYLKEKYPEDKYFQEKIRLIGLRTRKNFQGAISNYILLTHLEKGKFVYHTAGWGTGEILDISLIREEMTLEFEYVVGPKHLTFAKALNTLIPLADDHFLARRFSDRLEDEAKKDPVKIISLLLKDLGPKTAMDIKEELYDLVIPEEEWTKWWQNARSKLKKSTLIEYPKNQKTPFRLRKHALSHEQELIEALEKKPKIDNIIKLVYSFLRDFPEILKNMEFRENLQKKLKDVFLCGEIEDFQKIQISFLLEIAGEKEERAEDIIKKIEDFHLFLSKIEIIPFKKKVYSIIQKKKKNWEEIFLQELFSVPQNLLKDYLLAELEKSTYKEQLLEKLKDLLENPQKNPFMFVWYFQKILKNSKKHFLSDQQNINKFFEKFLILLEYISSKDIYRDLKKKMVYFLIGEKYQNVRLFMEQASIEEVKEFVLLATKCNVFSDHEIKILFSLSEVAYPSLKKDKKEKNEEEDVIWTTKKGYEKIQKRIEEIATKETIKNSKEIEEARALGDLRENAEYKAALEKRNRLQAELKMLSDSIKKARILTKDDMYIDQVGVGSVVTCKGDKEEKVFTILGPWDADPEGGVFSFQSKLASIMMGLRVGDVFDFGTEKFKIIKISNYFA